MPSDWHKPQQLLGAVGLWALHTAKALKFLLPLIQWLKRLKRPDRRNIRSISWRGALRFALNTKALQLEVEGKSLLNMKSKTSDLSHLSTEQPIDVKALRQRLSKMSDPELRRFGNAARHMCAPQANLGKPRREAFAVQLEEARAERKRRHP